MCPVRTCHVSRPHLPCVSSAPAMCLVCTGHVSRLHRPCPRRPPAMAMRGPVGREGGLGSVPGSCGWDRVRMGRRAVPMSRISNISQKPCNDLRREAYPGVKGHPCPNHNHPVVLPGAVVSPVSMGFSPARTARSWRGIPSHFRIPPPSPRRVATAGGPGRTMGSWRRSRGRNAGRGSLWRSGMAAEKGWQWWVAMRRSGMGPGGASGSAWAGGLRTSRRGWCGRWHRALRPKEAAGSVS